MGELERLRREQEEELRELERRFVERLELEEAHERLLREARLAEQVAYNPMLPPTVRELGRERHGSLLREAEALRRRLDESA
jgi:hypothetical protein